MLGFEFLTVGFHGAVWMMKKYCMHQQKKSLDRTCFPYKSWFFGKKKDEEKGGRGFYISFFYSLNKSNVLRLTEHCWDVNRGQTNCRYCSYSDRPYMAEGKVVRLILCTVSLAVRGSQSTFSASNFQLTLLSLDTHPSAKPLVFYHKG